MLSELISLDRLMDHIEAGCHVRGLEPAELVDATGVEPLTAYRLLRRQSLGEGELWVAAAFLQYLGLRWPSVELTLFDFAHGAPVPRLQPRHNPGSLSANLARCRNSSGRSISEAAGLFGAPESVIEALEIGMVDPEQMSVRLLAAYATVGHVPMCRVINYKPVGNSNLQPAEIEGVIEDIARILATRSEVDVSTFRQLIPLAEDDVLKHARDRVTSSGGRNRGGLLRVDQAYVTKLLWKVNPGRSQ